MSAAAAAPDQPAPSADGSEPAPGAILVAGRPVGARTVRGGLVVDLPRGREVAVVRIEGTDAIIEPGPHDLDLLRRYGVRRIPRYRVPLETLQESFLTGDAWKHFVEVETARLLRRWPGLSRGEAARLLRGEIWIGMTDGQAEEAIGPFVFSRETEGSPGGVETTWRIGRRSRSAELQEFTAGRERGARARTFEQHLAAKTRSVLRFRKGVLVAIEHAGPGDGSRRAVGGLDRR